VGHFFAAHLDPPAAAILRALVIGDEGKITREMWQDFSRTGVVHVLSISGLHLSIVAFSAFALCRWLLGRSRYLLLILTVPKVAALLAAAPVLFYAGMAGGSLPTWRAAIMVLVYLGAVLLDREREIYRSLALAALIISFLWPGSVQEISFQLSFLSVLSIFLGMERFRSVRETEGGGGQSLSDSSVSSGWQRHPLYKRVLRWSLIYLSVSFFALLGTAPAVAAHFNWVSLVALFANALVVPLLGSVAVILGLLAALLFFVQQTLAVVVVQLAGLVVAVGVWFVGIFAALPFAAVRVVTPTPFELLLLYGLMGCWLLWPAATERSDRAVRQRDQTERGKGGGSLSGGVPLLSPVSISVVLLLLLIGDAGYWVRERLFRPNLRVTFLDVGQGDAAVVEFPGSQVMVIDGGGFASEDFDPGEAIIAPFLWSRKINRVDYLVMSHPQLDHFGGLAFLVKNFSPRTLWSSGERSKGERFQQLEVTLDKEGVRVAALCAPGAKKVIGGVKVEVLHPPCDHPGLKTNDASLVLRLSYQGVDFLFPGDLERVGERILLQGKSPLTSEILKVPHHGSRTSSTAAFVAGVLPALAVVSAGSHNRFGFPAPEVVARYEERGSQVLRTDQVGAITIISNGQGYTVETFLPYPSG
jgi:competence protein ComEC